MKQKKMKRQIITQLLIIAAMVILLAIMLANLFPLVKNVVLDAGNESQMVDYIDSYGARGIPILMGLTALQIMIPFIPSAAIQVLTGLCYGAFWGTLINLCGCVLGNMIVFSSVRRMTNLLAPLKRHEKKHKKFISKEKLERLKRPELVAFFFFLIPGIPTGIVPYVFAETGISLKRYVIAAVLGSIPSTFILNYLGKSLSTGSLTTAIAIIVVAVAIFLAVMLFRNKILSKIMPGQGPKITV